MINRNIYFINNDIQCKNFFTIKNVNFLKSVSKITKNY